jgi:hypothetical protein
MASFRVSGYQLISQCLAQALNECRTEPISGVMLTIRQFGAVLSADNPSFDKLRMVDDLQLYVVNPRAFDALTALRNEYLSELPEVKEF